MDDCFAYERNRCKVLVVKKCQGACCSFYKNEEQHKLDQQLALDRIYTLDQHRQAYYLGKYHSREHKASNQ